MTATPPTRPWTLRVLEGVPLSPAAFGVVFVVGYLLLHVAVHAATGRLEDSRIVLPVFWERPRWWTEVVNAALLGYLAAMIRYGMHGAARDLADLRPVLRCSRAEFAALQRGLAFFDPRPLLAITALAVVLASCVALFDPRIWPDGGRPPLTDPVLLWVLGRHVLLGWLLGQALGMDVALTRRFSRIGAERVRVDLFDLSPLAPFARRGLRTVLLYAIGTAIFSLFWLEPATAGSGNALLLVVLVALAIAALVLPVRGVHGSIRAAKARELDWVRAAIRSHLAALRDTGAPASGTAAARLPALLDVERRLESVREWPFDVSTLVRFALYVTLGVGSWLGAALVERLLGAALD